MGWPKTPTKHGHATREHGVSPTYRSWQAMISRCTNIAVKSYKDYGARGISVHPSWLLFENFLTDMGEKPEGMSIERKNNEKGYEPGNCKWATKTEQNRNTRTNHIVTFDSRQMTQAEFVELVGLKQSTVSYRLRKGWTPKQIAETPPYTGNRIASKLGDEVDIPEELK